jgi:hypothetical protein
LTQIKSSILYPYFDYSKHGRSSRCLSTATACALPGARTDETPVQIKTQKELLG